MIDSVVGERFRVSERLARQGSVEIFKGHDLDEGQPVWIKRFSSPLDQDLDFIDNWRAQLISLQVIDNEHIPYILAFGRTPQDDLYQVEQPPTGITLRRYTTTHAPMSVSQSVKAVAAAARAIAVGHADGIAHGGPTPDMIYLQERENGQLEAFVNGWETGELIIGLRNAGESLPDRLLRYVAPEQLRSPAPPATPASDIYSLAAILYELLTGSIPIPDPELRPYAEPTSPRRFNPEVPTAVERVLLRALRPDPAERPPNGHNFASSLLEALSSPEPAPPPTTPPPVIRERIVIHRSPWLVAAAALLLFIFVCSLAIWALFNQQNQGAQQALATATATARGVPTLAGPPYLRYNEAVTVAWNQGYQVSIVGFVDAPDVPPGVVISQCPAAGSPPGSDASDCPLPVGFPPPGPDVVLVEVSSLPEPAVLRIVPDLYGQSEADARRALEAGGLRLGTRRVAYDMLMPPGRIVEQNPRRGLAILPGTAVDIIVSAGIPPEGAPLPGTPPLSEEPDQPAEPAETAEPTFTPANEAPFTPPPSPTQPAGYPEQPAGRTPTPTESNGEIDEEPDTAGVPTFEDSFEEDMGIWRVGEGPADAGSISDGRYSAEVPASTFWYAEAGQLFDDFNLRAVVTLVGETGNPDSGAGILFRIEDPSHFYFFEINDSGAYRLRARNDRDWITLIDWTSDPAIRLAGFDNVLAVEAEGERLSLFINDKEVTAGFDIPPELYFQAGDIGIGVEAQDDPVRAEFDSVRVTR